MRVFLTNQSLVLGASFILLLNSCSKEVKKQEFVIDIEKINLEFSSQTSFKTGVSGKWIVNALDEKGEPDKRITFSQPCVLSTLNKEPIIDFNSACGTGPAKISVHFNRPMISDVQTLTSKIFFKSDSVAETPNEIEIPLTAKMVSVDAKVSKINEYNPQASKSAYLPQNEQLDMEDGELIVVFKAKSSSKVQNFITNPHFKPISIVYSTHFSSVIVKSNDLEKDIQEIGQNPAVDYVEKNTKVYGLSMGKPKDEFINQEKHLNDLALGPVWNSFDLNHFSKPVRIAVLDSGVGGTDHRIHPDLDGAAYTLDGNDVVFTPGSIDLLACKTSPNIDCSGTGDGDGVDFKPFDPTLIGFSHGTHVTGIIAAQTGQFKQPCLDCNTQSGVVGVAGFAPITTSIVRVLDNKAAGSSFTAALGVLYASGETITIENIKNGKVFEETITNPAPAQVINMSLGGPNRSETLCRAVNIVAKKGVLMVAAAGNSGIEGLLYPAACEGALSVGSVEYSKDGDLVRAPYSNYGRWVDLLAFGSNVYSTDWQNGPKYSVLSGTSMASPQVAALAALLLSSGEASNPIEAGKMLVERSTRAPLDFPNGRVVNAGTILRATSTGTELVANLFHNDQLLKIFKPTDEFKLFLRPGNFELLFGPDKDGTGRLDNSAQKKTFFVSAQNEFSLGDLVY